MIGDAVPNFDKSVMLALTPAHPHELASTVDGALPPDELHVTLVYLGEIADEFDTVRVRDWAIDAMDGVQPGRQVMVDGVDEFGADGGAVVAKVSAGWLPPFRDVVAGELEAMGYPDASSFGWDAHMTFGYAPVGTVEHDQLLAHVQSLVGSSIAVDGVTMAAGGAHQHFPFGTITKAATMTKECSCHAKATSDIPADIHAALDYAAIAAALPVDEVDPAYFIPPDHLTASTKMSISLDGPLPGQVFGTVAPEGRCILDGGSSCWTVADLQHDDPNLDRVHQGDCRLTDGTLLQIAPLSGDVGHAPPGLSAQQANDWMGSTGTQFARVRYSYKEGVGLVAAGIAWPEIVANQRAVAALRASPTSLDARWLSAVAWLKDEGRYALCGAVFVNTPGLPLPRAAALGIYESETRFMLSFQGDDLGIIGEHAGAITAAATVETPASKPPAPVPVVSAPPSTDPAVLDRLTAVEGRLAELGQLVDALAKAELNRQDELVDRLTNDDAYDSVEGLVTR